MSGVGALEGPLPPPAMNVRSASDPRPALLAAAVDSARTGQAPPHEASSTAAASSAAADQDRVEISAAARAQADSASPVSPSLEMEVARVALRTGEELSPARLHQLRERVRTGYYDQPTVIDRIGEAVARDLVESGDAS